MEAEVDMESELGRITGNVQENGMDDCLVGFVEPVSLLFELLSFLSSSSSLLACRDEASLLELVRLV